MQAAPFEKLATGVYRSEAFVYAVEPNAAGDRFVAYAWPVARGKGGHRAFALTIDPNAMNSRARGELICEIDNPAYSGATARPAADAAVGAFVAGAVAGAALGASAGSFGWPGTSWGWPIRVWTLARPRSFSSRSRTWS